MKIYHVSSPMKIGLHEWRLNIRDFNIGGQIHVCTEYEWRGCNDPWRSAKNWPTYDHNDTYNGLPRSLRKLYEANHAAVDLFIYGRKPDQLVFFQSKRRGAVAGHSSPGSNSTIFIRQKCRDRAFGSVRLTGAKKRPDHEGLSKSNRTGAPVGGGINTKI
ncbi:hypothetical protein SAMN02787142_7731 [Burkholderia sp. WP9]|uniref:hypothetical protein n=1 Tax=Burkholderia sp. WP9 TaxID=1500263 RepID=UPI00089D914C|nr:hypothetical protein [Burkholderia sp. WP9]SEF11599.1 hypothetical protein SAMN02787142_7731 [Burkholderia sp. WP9]